MRYTEMVARIFVIETAIPAINKGIAKLGGEREYSYIGPVAILEDERWKLCQERNKLQEELAA